MRGLMPAAPPAASGGVPDAMPDAMPDDAGAAGLPDTDGMADSIDASPDEQAQYDRFVDNAYSLIYDRKILPGLVKRLQDKADPIGAVAGMAVMTVKRLRDSAARKGVELSPDVMFHGGSEIVEDLADLSAKVGGHKFSQQDVEGALYRALDQFREMETQQGGLDKKAVEQDFQALIEADRRGVLDRVLPGIGRDGAKPDQPIDGMEG